MVLLFGWLVKLFENLGNFFYWLLRKLLIFTLVTVVVTFVGLVAMFYRETGHLPSTGQRVSDFCDFAGGKLRFAERRVRTELDKIDWSQVTEPSRRLWESAQQKFDALQAEVLKAAEERAKKKAGQGGGTASTGSPSAQPSPATAAQDPNDAAMDQAMRWYRTGIEHYRKSFPGQAEYELNLFKALEAFLKSRDLLQEILDRDPQHEQAIEVRQSVEELLVDCRKRKRV